MLFGREFHRAAVDVSISRLPYLTFLLRFCSSDVVDEEHNISHYAHLVFYDDCQLACMDDNSRMIPITVTWQLLLQCPCFSFPVEALYKFAIFVSITTYDIDGILVYRTYWRLHSMYHRGKLLPSLLVHQILCCVQCANIGISSQYIDVLAITHNSSTL